MTVSAGISIALASQNGHNSKIYLERGDAAGYMGKLRYNQDSGTVQIVRGPENNPTIICTTDEKNVKTVEDLRGI